MSDGAVFSDRLDAGRRLAVLLADRDLRQPVVLGLPRCGVPVAGEVARVIAAPLDVALVRVVRVPRAPRIAMGFVLDNDPPEIRRNDELVASFGITDGELAAAEHAAVAELLRRRRRYRAVRPAVPIAGRTAVLVDQTIAAGDTMCAAIMLARRAGACRVVAAAPCCAQSATVRLELWADEIVCLERRSKADPSTCFENARQITHEQVVSCLAQSLA